MGRSKRIGNARQHQNKRKIKVKVSRKNKDDDQIHDDLKPEKRNALLNQPIDHDLPGKGQHYCLTCAKYCTDENSLKAHMKTKPHKRKLKSLKTAPYSQEEADRAAGMGSYKAPKDVDVKEQDIKESMEDSDG